MAGRWLDVSAAPRDGTPVLLWIEDGEEAPADPVTVGVWEINPVAGISCWRVFSARDSTSVYFDQHIRGWMPLPRPQIPGA